mmetsp:Transcript_51708/g.103806  ORF Transcript_51708/g.103806 Transcript_51708/m.103806 type:complete len:108 (-) Transcript_51708:1236-1559(-)
MSYSLSAPLLDKVAVLSTSLIFSATLSLSLLSLFSWLVTKSSFKDPELFLARSSDKCRRLFESGAPTSSGLQRAGSGGRVSPSFLVSEQRSAKSKRAWRSVIGPLKP